MNRQTLKEIITILILIELLLSIYLVYYQDSAFCLKGFSCAEVQNSSYAQLFGIKLTYFGLLAFAALFIVNALTLYTEHKRIKQLLMLMVSLGALFSIYFLSIQFFILKKVCSSCLLIDGLMILILLISIYEYKKYK